MNYDQFLNKIKGISLISLSIDKFISEWGDDLPVMLFGEIGKTIVNNLSNFSINECNDIFAYIEEGMLSGEELLKNCIATGLLESMYNSSQKENNWLNINNMLDPLSRQYVDEWINIGE
ncbi:TPA: hypothetical protein ACFP4Q_002128 [Neisseria weaveri]|uniref:DUF7674 domain-containing protein n=1 Tax=Neisseria weaveri TaxID=28091 RepID=A0A3S4Z131_9NEIS|nr:hypothetical protein [Neisseria weaveri]VEJ49079.1 Uncharacterised protein [Neisseria weaveri]